VLEPHWAYSVTDGVAQFLIDPATKQLRFTAPNLETFVYIDPAMHDVKGTFAGEFKDDRWHIRYAVPTTHGVATVAVKDLWTTNRAYALSGAPISQ
jgi:hypothetical protein